MKKIRPFWVLMVLGALLFSFVVCNQAVAQQQDNKPVVNPLAQLLHAKGILTDAEYAQIMQASSASDADLRLAKVLLAKGIITQADYDQTVAASNAAVVKASGATPTTPATPASSSGTSAVPQAVPATYRVPNNSAAGAAPAGAQPATPDVPTVVPAITPVRFMPVDPPKREGLIPAIKLGAVSMTPYGFIKATAVHDSSSPNGDDFPLPGFLGDTVGNSPEFHVKARSSRIGTNFEWLDPSPNLTITGKVEIDFEGNFSRADNRNLSTERSNMPSLRVAWGRIDYKFGSSDTATFLIGQDWTPFASSTLPNILETTGLALSMGNIYERAPLIKGGWTHSFGSFKILGEAAMVDPISGVVPGANELADQLGYGERQGADSNRPSVEARVVAQFQLDHAPGVAPAQLIVSGEEGKRTALVLAAAIPAAYQTFFPNGASVSSESYGWTGEFQLPTRWATLIGKYYQGSDLRFFFGGELFSNFSDRFGLTGVESGLSIDQASTVYFGTNASGIAVVAPQRPVRTNGGFMQLGLPLSRWFNADPRGRNAGWQLYFYGGIDQAKTRDLLFAEPDGSRGKSEMFAGTIYYKLNNWVTFSFEQSLYSTYANTAAAGLPLLNGIPSRQWHDIRSEGGTIFTF